MCFLAGLLPFITVLVTHTRYSGSVNPLRTILKSRRVTTLERENFLKFTLSLQPSLHPHLSKVRWHHPGTSASPLRMRSTPAPHSLPSPASFQGAANRAWLRWPSSGSRKGSAAPGPACGSATPHRRGFSPLLQLQRHFSGLSVSR